MKSDLKNQERIELWKLVTRQTWFLTERGWPFTRREIMGIISDPVVITKLGRRLYQKVRPKSSRPRRVQRHRGYRDHGQLRPPHKWLPKTDFSLTEIQNKIELERERLDRYYQLVQMGKQPIAIEDYPTIFDL
jgi:hypothetical protein